MTSAFELLGVPLKNRNKTHLIEMLRCATKLEHATLPPYLTAMWSIKNQKHPAYKILRSIVYEEMCHMGTACNILTTIGEIPSLSDKDFIPIYPTRLPCGIVPKVIPPNVLQWKVGLSRLTPAVVSDVFMIIEYPEKGPVQTIEFAGKKPTRRFHTIGEFYDAIAETLAFLVKAGRVHITGQKQLSEPFVGHDENHQNVLKPITTLDEALTAIEHIKEQGEGTPSTPDAPLFGGELAHYYKFKQIQVGRLFAQVADGSWTLSGSFFDFPEVWPMADVPAAGYDTPPAPVAALLTKFKQDYDHLLLSLQSAWKKGGDAGGQDDLNAAEDTMRGLRGTATSLMGIAIDESGDLSKKGTYGPLFRVS
jgi:hypothetical protein